MQRNTVHPALELVQAWKLLAEQGVRRRDAASRLGVAEAQVVDGLTRVGEARRLRTDWRGILERVPSLGRTMALTRNDACVIEKTGVYGAPDFASAHLGQVTGPDIDLRLFLNHWSSGFAVDHGDDRRSLEFFGSDGHAVHKIHARDATNFHEWDALVTEFAQQGEVPDLTIAAPPETVERPDGEVDVPGYLAALAGMTNAHDFFGIMRRFHLTREQALRLGGPQFASPVAAPSYRDILHGASRNAVPIMVFVGNPGVIEIHTGPVHHVVERDGYLNVLDKSFNLHLLEAPVTRAWVVRKPTSDGIISSLEIYDDSGEMIVQFFGERHSGEAERSDWRELLAHLSPLKHQA